MLDLTVCPEPTCEAIAEVVDRFVLESTDGPLEMGRTLCLHRHIFLLPTARVRRDPQWSPPRSWTNKR
jgi:hypothetical protein